MYRWTSTEKINDASTGETLETLCSLSYSSDSAISIYYVHYYYGQGLGETFNC